MDSKQIPPLSTLNYGNFQFTAVGLNRIATASVTLVTIVVDVSESVEDYRAELEKCLDHILEACKLSPNHDSLLIRVISFNSTVRELTGFLPIADHGSFVGRLHPSGCTALVDATLDALSGIQGYAETLHKQDYLANGYMVVVTDGVGNTGSEMDPAAIAALVQRMIEGDKKNKVEPVLESLQSILVAVNAASCIKRLKAFHAAAGLGQFVDLGDASANQIAKLVGFISKSISSSSQALGTGQAPAPVNPQSVGI